MMATPRSNITPRQPIPPHDAAVLNERANACLGAGDARRAIALYRQALRHLPDHAELHYNLANALAQDGRLAPALAAYRRALAVAPAHAGAHTNLGTLLRRLKRPDAALESYRRAVHLCPHDAAARYNLATALLDLHRPEEALAWLHQAAQGRPPHLPAFASIGEALLRLGRAEEALSWFCRARQVRPDDLQSRFGEGLALLTLGRLDEGWEGFEARLQDARLRVPRADPAIPRWHAGMEPGGTTILVLAEQGAGDTIQFARYLPLLRRRGARVVLCAPGPLHRLLGGLADVTIGPEDPVPRCDAQIPLLSLPHAFATTLATIPAEIPYLHAGARQRQEWRARIGARQGLQVGLAWSGNPDHEMDRHRSIRLADLAPLLAVPGVTFHALQTMIRRQDAAEMRRATQLRNHAAALHDFADTAAILAAMDLVISVDTSIAHLAGAMGRPLWVLVPYAADFRWMRARTDSPWYPTARLWRQPRPGDWRSPIAQIAAALLRFRPARD